MRTIRLEGTKSKSWNADKTIRIFVDGERLGWFLWGMSLKKAYQIVKGTLGIKRARKEFVYAEEETEVAC